MKALKYAWWAAAAIALALAVSGCGSIGVTAGNPRLPVAALETELQAGVSTRADVLRVLGEPYGMGGAQLPFHRAPRKTWTYFGEQGSADLGKGSIDDERTYLFVFFDGDTFDSYMWFRSRIATGK